MPVISTRALMIAAVALAGLGASACAPLRAHQGYVVDADLVNSVQPGVDTRESVAAVLGKPTIEGQFNDSSWYYLGRATRNYAFNNPTPVDQFTLQIRFAPDGTVQSVNRTGKELVASINPSDKKTPTLGRERGFFEDLFGNIGSVGAGGMGGGGGGQQP